VRTCTIEIGEELGASGGNTRVLIRIWGNGKYVLLATHWTVVTVMAEAKMSRVLKLCPGCLYR
jgi:hypothetical protein